MWMNTVSRNLVIGEQITYVNADRSEHRVNMISHTHEKIHMYCTHFPESKILFYPQWFEISHKTVVNFYTLGH